MVEDQKEFRERSIGNILSQVALILIVLYVFLLSIDLLSSSFTLLGKEAVKSFILLTSNPFTSLFIGLLVTAIIQSSSTVTSMVVALVATGSMELHNAIPMIMGANIGTTLTSSLVSLAFIAKRKEFRKAISAGIIHDIFNIIVTIIIFPLEYYYGFLSRLTPIVSRWITPSLFNGNNEGFNLNAFYTSYFSHSINELINNPFISIILAFFLLFGSIKILSSLIYKLLQGEFSEKLSQHLHSPITSFSWGTLLTAAVQSSSITTSLIVPVVATGKINLKKAFPFIMGANIGTTITAFLAAMFKSESAVSIAVAHLLFNLLGVLIFLPFPVLRNIPVMISREVGKATMKHRLIGLIYIIATFFLIPFLLIYFYEMNQ
ncbi:MAG: Na/Pi symporter [Candidatus Cyclobacteriaceae bacterium M3_2C_046]